jgi:hypothetical protein
VKAQLVTGLGGSAFIVGQKIGRARKCGSVCALLQPHSAIEYHCHVSAERHSFKNSEDDQRHHEGHLAFAQEHMTLT